MPAICIKVIFILLVGLQVRDDWLEPRGTNLCRTCHRPKLFLGLLGGSYVRDWTSRIAWYEAFYLKEFPKASGLLYPAEHGGAFLRD